MFHLHHILLLWELLNRLKLVGDDDNDDPIDRNQSWSWTSTLLIRGFKKTLKSNYEVFYSTLLTSLSLRYI